MSIVFHQHFLKLHIVFDWSKKYLNKIYINKLFVYLDTNYKIIICDCLSKNQQLALQLNSILLLQFTDIVNFYPSLEYQVLNVNWSFFLKGILPILQSHSWNNGTNGGHQLGSGIWICSQWHYAYYCVIGHYMHLWLLMGCPKLGVMTSPPTHPTLLL